MATTTNQWTMFTLYSNDEIYTLVANHYTGTAAVTGHVGFILNALKQREAPYGEAMLERLKNNISKVKTLALCVSHLHATAQLVERLGVEHKEEFLRVAEQALEVPVEPSTGRGSYISPTNFPEFVKGVESPVGKAQLVLAYIAGLTPNDLLRELNNLAYLKDGLANVGERFNDKNTAPRTVHFDPSLLNEVDPEGEVLGIVQNIAKTTDANNAGLKGLVLGQYYQGSGYTIQDLRNCHAINLLNEGYLNSEVAEIQGISGHSLSKRLRQFRTNAGL